MYGVTLNKILIINAEGTSATALYRAFAAEHCFRKLGFIVEIHSLENTKHIDIKNVSACLFIRTPLFPSVSAFVSRLKSADVTVIADFDDLIFRPDLLHLFDGAKYMSSEECQQFTDRTFLFQEMVKIADSAVGTTTPLVEELSKFNKNIKLIRNYPLEITKSMAWKVRLLKCNPEKFVIGYYSGTLTHQIDFRQCSAALADLLSHNDNVELRIVGELAIGEFTEFKMLKSRIIKLPLMSYDMMLLDLATCHVNLAPLEVGNLFCECKSELKYFDAALMGVPTVASPTLPYRMAIKDGTNGYIAETENEWRKCLELLLKNRELTHDVGLNARRHALSSFGEAAQLRDYRLLASSFPVRCG